MSWRFRDHRRVREFYSRRVPLPAPCRVWSRGRCASIGPMLPAGWPAASLPAPVPGLPPPGFVVPGLAPVPGFGLPAVLAPWRGLSARRLAAVLEALAVGPSDWFVDFGCGDGRVLEAAARSAGRVLGVELDPGLALLARRRFVGLPSVEVLHEPLGLRPLPGPTCGLLHLLPSAHAFFSDAVAPWLSAGFRLATVGFPYRPHLLPESLLACGRPRGSVFVVTLPVAIRGA